MSATPRSAARLGALASICLGLPLAIVVIPGGAWLIGRGLHALSRTPEPFATWWAAGLRFEHPAGMLAANLAIVLVGVLGVVLTAVFVDPARPLRWGRALRWCPRVGDGRRRLSLRLLVLGVAVAAVVFAVRLLALMLVGDASSAPRVGGAPPTWPWFLLVMLLTTPLQALAEEVFFRGWLQRALAVATGRIVVAALVQAVLFSLFHGGQSPALFVDRFVFALVFGFIAHRSGGVELSGGAHVVNNLMAFGLALASGGLTQARTLTDVSWAVVAVDVASFVVLGVVLRFLAPRTLGPRTERSSSPSILARR